MLGRGGKAVLCNAHVTILAVHSVDGLVGIAVAAKLGQPLACCWVDGCPAAIHGLLKHDGHPLLCIQV